MKNFKIAVATAALALASGYAVAATTSPPTVHQFNGMATYYLASPLGVTNGDTLVFPPLVTNTAQETTVTVPATGSLTFSAGGSPGTSNLGTWGAGSFAVTGDTNFNFGASLDPNANSVASGVFTIPTTNLTMDNFSFNDGTHTYSGSQSLVLSSGAATITYGATLHAPAGTTSTSTTSSSISIPLVISYE